MYRQRLENTPTKSKGSKRLQRALLDYHDFQLELNTNQTAKSLMAELSDWQIKRLINSHKTLYDSEKYHAGLNFLFSDLYAPKDFSARDNDLERIFPKLVKLMPDKILTTVAQLVELNLLTQRLDRQLAEALEREITTHLIDMSSYSAAYRHSAPLVDRQQQLAQVLEVGQLLDKYARSSSILFSLKITKTPAEMAGLGALHDFILRGFEAFHDMENIPFLMNEVVSKERAMLRRVFEGGCFDT